MKTPDSIRELAQDSLTRLLALPHSNRPAWFAQLLSETPDIAGGYTIEYTVTRRLPGEEPQVVGTGRSSEHGDLDPGLTEVIEQIRHRTWQPANDIDPRDIP